MPMNMDLLFDFRNDHRTCRKVSKEVKSFEEAYGEELPTYKIVCPTCNGTGKHVNPAIDCNGLSHADFDCDPDFHESYMRGDYDVSCYECGGNNVVDSVDREKAKRDCPELLAEFDDWMQSAAESDAIEAAERRMGA